MVIGAKGQVESFLASLLALTIKIFRITDNAQMGKHLDSFDVIITANVH